jgi:hypothetical protein
MGERENVDTFNNTLAALGTPAAQIPQGKKRSPS